MKLFEAPVQNLQKPRKYLSDKIYSNSPTVDMYALSSFMTRLWNLANLVIEL